MKVGSTIKNYKILDKLRPGAGGNVYVVEDINTHEKFVLKSSYYEESKKSQFEKIVSGWKDLSCKNIVEFKEFFYEGTESFVVMEYCTGGDLGSIIKKMKAAKKKFTEAEIAKIATDVLKGVQAMHAMKMIHRDLKCANILKAEDGTYKLADFNVSRVLSDDPAATMTFAGTMQYVAPELLQNKPTSFASDIYALGAVFYELITLTPAFSGMDIPSILVNRYRPLDASLGYSEGIAQLVHRMLALNPADRPTADSALSVPVLERAQAEAAECGKCSHAASIAALQQSVAEQLDTIRTLRRTVGEQQETIDSLEVKIENLERTVSEQQEKLDQQQAKADERQGKIDSLQTGLATMQTTVKDLCRRSTGPFVTAEDPPKSITAPPGGMTVEDPPKSITAPPGGGAAVEDLRRSTTAGAAVEDLRRSTTARPPQLQLKAHICTKKDMETGRGKGGFGDNSIYPGFGGRCDKCKRHDQQFPGGLRGGGGPLSFCDNRCRSCKKNYCKKCVEQMPQ